MRVLFVDDCASDAELEAHLLADGGLPCIWRRVEAEHEFRTVLQNFRPDLIISDFTLPGYDGLAALDLAVAEAPEIPFLFVSGSIGEQRAAEGMTRGAEAYICKRDLDRLVPTVTRILNEHRLPLALERDQFRLHYQPICEISTGRVVAAEALLRWCDPDRGPIAPMEFLPVLQAKGLMGGVGEWTLLRALRDVQGWRDTTVAPPRIAVNVSPAELAGEYFETLVLDAASQCGLGAWLDIEITERAFVERPEVVKRLLRQLRAAGVRVVIDDFGAGLAPLSRLVELPLDRLKIDRAFTDRIVESRQNHAIVATILTMANDLGLTTIAEGVETSEQAAILKSLGCVLGQGCLYSAPITADQMEGLLAGQRSPVN